MKKVILIVSVLGLLWGCKKEKVEPVEVDSANPNTTNGRFDQPKFAEITSYNFKHKLDFSYNSQGLVANISSTIDTLNGAKGEKEYEAKYEYQNDLISKLSYKKYPNPFIEFAEPEFISMVEAEVNYVYEGSLVKQMNIKNDIQIDKTEQNSFFYDSEGNVDYILTKTISAGNTQFTDSINFIYTKESNTTKVTKEEFKNTSYFDPKGLTPKDTGANAFVRFDQSTDYTFSEIEFGSKHGIYTYSKLSKRFQEEVYRPIFGYLGFSRIESLTFSRFMKSYFIESKSETSFGSKNRVFEYEYKTNDKGQLINFTPKLVGIPTVSNMFDNQFIKIIY